MDDIIEALKANPGRRFTRRRLATVEEKCGPLERLLAGLIANYPSARAPVRNIPPLRVGRVRIVR